MAVAVDVARGHTYPALVPRRIGPEVVEQLFAVVENYPQIRSEQNVLDLQNEIERLEEVIADRREFYNDTVYRYNTRIGQLPALLLTAIFGWEARPFFRAPPEDVARPNVELRPA